MKGKQYRFECLNKFNKFGIEFGFDFHELIDNFDLMVELDELIDYDVNLAINRARMELHQGEGLAHYRDEIKLIKGELKRIHKEQQKILGRINNEEGKNS